MAWSQSLVWKCSHKLQWHSKKKKKSGSICFERIQDILPQISDYGILIILSAKALRKTAGKDFLFFSLTCLDFLRTDPAEWTHLSLLSSLGVPSTIGGWLLSQKRKLEVHFTQTTLSQTIILPICSSKGPFIFPNNHFLYPYSPGGSDSKASAYKAGDPGLIPGLERSPGEGNGNPL